MPMGKARAALARRFKAPEIEPRLPAHSPSSLRFRVL
jgi:hypothetical protein